jgi:dihydropteroate synthase type 2
VTGKPALFGILNVTRDSFSDGGRFLDARAAVAHGEALVLGGAAAIDIGAAASNPAAEAVPPDVEIARLAPVVAALRDRGISVCVDSFATDVQRWALGQGVPYLNDIQGFADPGFYPELAAAPAQLIVMHSVQGRGKATVTGVAPDAILGRIAQFFDARLAALTQAGVARDRLILDPGMGFFLGDDPRCSLAALKGLRQLKARYGLPILVSVSRKSFVRRLAGVSAEASGPATLAAELFAAEQGVDYIRTHDPHALRAALAIRAAISEDGGVSVF